MPMHQDPLLVAGCGSLLWANTCSLWSGIKSWPGAGSTEGVYGGWSGVVVSSQLRLCHTCIIDVMDCCLYGAKPLFQAMLVHCQLISFRNKFQLNYVKRQQLSYKKMNLNMLSAKWQPLCPCLKMLCITDHLCDWPAWPVDYLHRPRPWFNIKIPSY